MRQAAIRRLRAWAARRHGADSLPIKINRRRIYILPTRSGIMLAMMLVAMLLAGLNYNSNLGLAFAFLMVGVGLVTMHHCNRNLLGLQVDVTTEVDAFAGREASFEFVLRNDSKVERRDVEIRCMTAGGMRCVPARSSESVPVAVPVLRRGVLRIDQFELRTRYPFGWFHAWTYVQGSLTAYVAPSPNGSRTLPPGGGAGSASRSEARGDEDFAGLRAYEPGVPLKHMAWKVLARGGEAAVRSYTSLASQPEWLDWSSLEGQDTEARLSQLCLWVLECEAAQRVFGLKIPGKEIPPGRGAAHRFACLRALAVYGIAEPR
jgi:uncharacterized protein (DUF58 family)